MKSAGLGLTALVTALSYTACSAPAVPSDSESVTESPLTGANDGCAPLTIGKSAIQAVGYEAGSVNIPTNVVDNDLATRWSNLGIGSWIQADLQSVTSVCSVDVAWYQGNTRQNNFAIAVSTDGATFTQVMTGKSSGTTTGKENYAWNRTPARYVRLIVNANTLNTWASVTEFGARTASSTSTPPPSTPAPSIPPPSNPAPANGIPTAKRTVNVSSVAALQTAVQNALAGDHIVVANGTYTTSGPITVRVKGTATDPIVITAASVGGVEIAGAAGFKLAGASQVIIQGFKFTHNTFDGDGVELNGCTNVRITRNTFALTNRNSGSWLLIEGNNSGQNKIDHNVFQNKSTLGQFFTINGGSNTISHDDLIEANYFHGQTYTGDNGGECIRLGDSPWQHLSARTIVRGNLFEQCVGDSEYLSNKATDTSIIGNTFRNNRGGLSLRHGNHVLVEGNFLDAEKTEPPLQIFGDDHRIINNQVNGSSDWGMVYLGSGTVDDDTTVGPSDQYDRPERVVIAFNTVVNGGTARVLRIGDSRGHHPIDCVIANNIVKADTGQIVGLFAPVSGFAWEGNISGGKASQGDVSTGFRRVDPMLTLVSGVLRLQSGSPAIDGSLNASAYSFVGLDGEGQPRSDGKPDVGADEVSTATVRRRPLTAADVGPGAP